MPEPQVGDSLFNSLPSGAVASVVCMLRSLVLTATLKVSCFSQRLQVSPWPGHASQEAGDRLELGLLAKLCHPFDQQLTTPPMAG